MIGKAATVVIVLSKGSGEVGPDTVVLGIPLLRRIVMAVSRAGHRDILVVDDGSFGSERLLKGTTAAPLPPTRLADNQRSSRILVLASNVLPHPSLLRHLGEIPLQVETAYVLTSGIAAVETADPKAFLSMIGRANDILSLFAELEQTYRSAAPMPDNTRWVEVSNRGDLNNAEEWLLRGLIKDTEGFMSRHVERKISLAVTRRLVGTDITPNQMTAVSVAIGVVGALFFLSSTPAYQLVGALLFLLHSILDGCDGEIARLKYLESRFGGLLDFWGDNAVHSAVFVCIGLGWWMVDGALLPLLLACSATVGGLLSAGFVYRQTMRQKTSEGPLFTSTTTAEASSRLSNLADALARRDFIYLVVLLSAFGKAHWFLMLAAVGAPIFFMVILWNSYRERVQA
ncbi:membrane protein [Candidatus Methylomirabilis lanthanidiphila]|uniref:Membrane protein n=1 Tax=Candidatus Methylomirabilis lanthanidiphila TaxID=2211376 RepID=A0A564ZM92_9BACT|nr:CDP-alcohol phosphatidyltransferase family protein [Candidatus Methylomirabilis lanthanidiphila]VUZ86431.1 membrane protein [Candidatus Methylomirabilis lanthanidiphila]